MSHPPASLKKPFPLQVSGLILIPLKRRLPESAKTPDSRPQGHRAKVL